jgi:hypothetical protein
MQQLRPCPAMLRMRTDAPIAGFWVWLGKEFEPLP